MHTPKQLLKKKTEYQYYAGFSSDFVVDILKKYSKPGSRVLDPWNGSGTTTSVCAANGIKSVGIDINPATVPIAWSRLAPPYLTETLCARITSAKSNAFFTETVQAREDDLMEAFFDDASCKLIRGLRNWLILNSRELTSKLSVKDEQSLSGVAFVILAEVLRDALRPLRSTNPSWFSRPKQLSNRLSLNRANLESAVSRISNKIFPSRQEVEPKLSGTFLWPDISIGDATKDISKLGSFDLVISSPPYCTRIDYAVATIPELIALGNISRLGFDELRKRIMGTMITDNANLQYGEFLSGSLLDRTMQSIFNHPTKAASTYYARYFSRYFKDLGYAVEQLTNCVESGHVALVVQNSFFKEVELDLRGILVEMVEDRGFVLTSARKYPSRPTIAESNPKSKLYRNSNIRIEDVLVFSKNCEAFNGK